MNFPTGWYRIMKSISGLEPASGSPRLISSRFAWWPFAVVINRFVCVVFTVIGLTTTMRGSRSECSAENASGSPSTTELIASGIRMAVANRGAR